MHTVQFLVYLQMVCVAMMKEFFRDFIIDCSFLEAADRDDYTEELEMFLKFLCFIIPTGQYIEEAIKECPKEFIIFVLKRQVDNIDELCGHAYVAGDKCTTEEYDLLEKLKKKLTSGSG